MSDLGNTSAETNVSGSGNTSVLETDAIISLEQIRVTDTEKTADEGTSVEVAVDSANIEDYDEIEDVDDSDVETGLPSKQVPSVVKEIVDDETASNGMKHQTTIPVVEEVQLEDNENDDKVDEEIDTIEGSVRSTSSNRKKVARPKTACGYPIPFPLKGMMLKMSTGLIKHWNKRYFQLERGALIYFEPVHWYLKGQYDLVGLEVSSCCECNSDLIIKLVGPDRADFLFKPEDMEMKVKWIKALKEHIAFANYVSVQVKKSLESPTPNQEVSTMRQTTSRNRSRTGKSHFVCLCVYLWNRDYLSPFLSLSLSLSRSLAVFLSLSLSSHCSADGSWLALQERSVFPHNSKKILSIAGRSGLLL
jgi:hypothetical protein